MGSTILPLPYLLCSLQNRTVAKTIRTRPRRSKWLSPYCVVSMNKTTFSNLFHELATATRTSHGKGALFERLMKRYLTVDPQYGNCLADVWLWSEWPHRQGLDQLT